MKPRSAQLIILSFAFCFASFNVTAQHGRRARPALRSSRSSEVKPVNVNQTNPEEDALLAEECSLPDKPKPETATRMAVLCGKAISLPKPLYPEEAKAAKVSGAVTVSVVMNEKGRVIWARAISGHPLLQASAIRAACRARYSPILIKGRAVKAETLITYNFINQ